MYNASIRMLGRLTRDITHFEGEHGGGVTALAVNMGYGEKQKTEFWDIFMDEEMYQKMTKAKVKKGAALILEGTPRIEGKEFVVDGKKEYAHKVKIFLSDWMYVPSSSKKDEFSQQETAASVSKDVAPSFENIPEGFIADEGVPNPEDIL